MGDADRKTLHIEVTIASPPDAVWHALRDKDTIRQWHGWHASELDGEIDLIYFTGMTEDLAGRVLTLKNGDRFTLTPDSGGTRITMTRAPLGANPEWDAYYDDITEGWISFLHQLKFALERQPGVARRTLFFSHHGKDSGSIIQRLGLGGPAQQPPGSAYATTLVGEEVSGEVWFRSDHQLGVTVDAWGHDGLLVAVGAPSAASGGTTMAILTTYRLDDTRFGDLDSRWTRWFAEHYPTTTQENPE